LYINESYYLILLNIHFKRELASNTYYYIKDRQYSIQAITNSLGNIVESYSYNSFGIMTMKDQNGQVILKSNVNNTITFTGRRYDQESELYYYRNRMYSPTLGRFMQRDPKGYIDGMNLYAYVKNNPLKYLDAMGTQISNNRSAWERITTGLGNSFSTLWDRRDDIGNDISTAYDGGVQGTQDMLVNAPTYAKLPLYVASSITLGGLAVPAGEAVIATSLSHPVGMIGTMGVVNDVVNPSMPATSPAGMLYNMYDNKDKVIDFFKGIFE